MSYPKGDLSKLTTPYERVNALVLAEAAARTMLDNHVPRPEWVTDKMIAPKSAAVEAIRQADESYDEVNQYITITDEAFRSKLWSDYITARAGMWPLINILQSPHDEFYEVSLAHDFPYRLGIFQAVYDQAKAYGERKDESTFRKLFCAVSPGACWVYDKAKAAFSGYVDVRHPAVMVSVRQPALGAGPLAPLIVKAGTTALVILGAYLITAHYWSKYAIRDTDAFNTRYMARCTEPNKSDADTEWCNNVGGPTPTFAQSLARGMTIVGVVAVLGLFGYRLLERQLDRAGSPKALA